MASNHSDETLNIKFYHVGQIGLPKELTTESDELSWFAQYQTWGKLEKSENIIQTHQPLRFQGQYEDEETGLHYNLFRCYEPDIGKFVNQDPIKSEGG